MKDVSGPDLSAGAPGAPHSTFDQVRRIATSRRGLLIGSLILIGIGAFASWDWLVAAGIAPILIAVGPCLAMCGLGLCMRGGDCKETNSTTAGTPPGSNERRS